ncbi:MAG TPA: alanine-tRNA synthetase second additional domain-containing protein [Desulfitobacteriaceae bacterium]|nr:alanine-tRNA synthetase second additional domain-containing protein [Desulfitobacteriaceae bacterium]
MKFVSDYLAQAEYFVPRGKKRLLILGDILQQRYTCPEDKLIGVLGDAGAGKSLLIRGMFPGLELTNDNKGIYTRPLSLLADFEGGNFRLPGYHLDVLFETAFIQPWLLAEAVKKAVLAGRRVVIEHFELLYPLLGFNAEVLIGIGEEIIVTRPTIFGSDPEALARIVFESLRYRRMAHSAEDLTAMILAEMPSVPPAAHRTVRHGFVLEFPEKPDLDCSQLEEQVKALIKADLAISFLDEEHIRIGDKPFPCTEPGMHIRRTGQITGFCFLRELRYDPLRRLYALIGVFGQESI